MGNCKNSNKGGLELSEAQETCRKLIIKKAVTNLNYNSLNQRGFSAIETIKLDILLSFYSTSSGSIAQAERKWPRQNGVSF
jgi:hypothetical protein